MLDVSFFFFVTTRYERYVAVSVLKYRLNDKTRKINND